MFCGIRAVTNKHFGSSVDNLMENSHEPGILPLLREIAEKREAKL